ncbi:hypothetical protein R6Y95_06175 [Methanoculleus palmolei]|uniref:Uncharacterized protein n=1 Tax=Methanoculleus palmolei TaxID=72612 RepID=A0ABD8A676_9EURY|nr:hypothetical protein R6Y95_06175 [Methanoculleus palmolei]
MTEYLDLIKSRSEVTLLAVMQCVAHGETASVKNVAKMVLKDEHIVHCIPCIPTLDDIEDIVVAVAERWGFTVRSQEGERVVVGVEDW